MDCAFAIGLAPDPCGMDRARYDRPWVVCPLAVSADRCSGLAPPDARSPARARFARTDRGPPSRSWRLFQSQANGGKDARRDFREKSARSRLDCTLFACWEFGHEEPWFIVTDLEPDQSEGLWYAMRAWIEHGFKLLKSQGWQWQKSRMTDPDRASRLWLVLAVATRYVLAVGGEADASDTDDQTVASATLRVWNHSHRQASR